MCSFKDLKWSIGHTHEEIITDSEWMRELIPDADSLWPTDDFNATRNILGKPFVHPCACLRTIMIAPSSIGSPRAVPVPCSRMPSTLSSNPARLMALRITFCCATPFGAVKELDWPSWLISELRILIDTMPSVMNGSMTFVRYIAMHDSARVYPSAVESKVLHRPSAASIPALSKMIDVCKAWSKFTLATHARPFRGSCKRTHIAEAVFKATSEDEQAVSIATAAPANPWVNAIRPAATLWAPPVASKDDDDDDDDVRSDFPMRIWWSVLDIPTKTPTSYPSWSPSLCCDSKAASALYEVVNKHPCWVSILKSSEIVILNTKASNVSNMSMWTPKFGTHENIPWSSTCQRENGEQPTLSSCSCTDMHCFDLLATNSRLSWTTRGLSVWNFKATQLWWEVSEEHIYRERS